jgi:hypothetical protein
VGCVDLDKGSPLYLEILVATYPEFTFFVPEPPFEVLLDLVAMAGGEFSRHDWLT